MVQKKNELYHYGRKGMKWGKHIFGKDRSGSSLGITDLREDSGESKSKGKGSALSQDIPSGKGNANRSVSQVVAKETNDAVEKVQKAVKTVGEGYKRQKQISNNRKMQQEVSQMSDADLQREINRMNLERRYSELKKDDVKDGFDRANEILAIAGGVAAVAVSATTIASTIYNMKKKQSGN